MDNTDHMSAPLSTINDLVMKVNCLPCHPKNKLLLYHHFVLSKLSWHLTIANLSKTWVIENLDNIVASYVRKWLELPISATISSLILNKSCYGISLALPSTKFIKCETFIWNALKSSPNFERLFGLRLAMVPISNMINFKIQRRFSSLFNRITRRD